MKIEDQFGDQIIVNDFYLNGNEEIIANENGRYPCRNCNQTFKYKAHARRHEKKNCKNEFTTPDINYKNNELVTNENGRFQYKNCNQTFKLKNLSGDIKVNHAKVNLPTK